MRKRRAGRAWVAALVGAALVASCKSAPRKPEPARPRTAPRDVGVPQEPLPVVKVPEQLVVAAWSEPKQLRAGGGQAQILVKVQKKGGDPFAGVQVRLRTTAGRLFSGGKVLLTDASGRTRDQLTTRSSAVITLNAGGTVYRFRVGVGADSSE